MSYKLASCISSLFFCILGILFFISAQKLPQPSGNFIGPGYFPTIISVLLVVLSIVSFITTLRNKDKRVELPKPENIILIIILSIAFIVSWYLTGLFYVTTFIVVVAMLYLLNPEKNYTRKIVVTLVIALFIVAFIYLVFDQLLNFRF